MPRRKKSKLLPFVGVLLLVLFLLPVVAYISSNRAKREWEGHTTTTGKNQENITYTLPFGPNTGISIFIDTRFLAQNASVELTNTTLSLIVVKPGWPFTVVTDGAREFKIPTILIGLPYELTRKNFSSPIETYGIKEGLCLPFEYSSMNGGIYIASTPESCKQVVVNLKYSDNNILDRGVIYSPVSNVVYEEIYYVYSWSNLQNYTVTIPKDKLAFCLGYYALNITYTTPGTYEFYKPGVRYLGGSIPTQYGRLLLLYKSPEANKIWVKLPLNYKGYVVVVSPLMKNLGSIPYIDKLQEKKAILIEGNNVTEGVDAVEAQLEKG